MKIYKLHEVDYSIRGEYVFNCGYKYSPYKYGIRIDVSNNVEYLEDCIYIPDNVIEDKIKRADHDEIIWDDLKNNKIYYLVCFINDSIVAYNDDLYKVVKDLSNSSIDYKTWIIKKLIE